MRLGVVLAIKTTSLTCCLASVWALLRGRLERRRSTRANHPPIPCALGTHTHHAELLCSTRLWTIQFPPFPTVEGVAR